MSDSNDIAILVSLRTTHASAHRIAEQMQYSQSFVVKDEVKARVSERGKTVQKVFRIAHAEWSSGDGSYRYKLKNRTDEKRVGGGEGTWFLEDDLSFAR